jgi:ClpP class serine protease
MTKIHFISKLLSAVWGLDKIRGRVVLTSIIQPLLPRNGDGPPSGRGDRPSEDMCGDPLPCMTKVGDIALIPLTGVLSIDVPSWLKEYGVNLTDVNDIEEEIEDALQDANVRMIIFDVNSPGGLSLAGNKLFEIVEAANRLKPCFAYCGAGRDMASAAYDAVAACTALACSPHAEGVGCIGSYCAYLDDSEFWAQMGMKWEIFKSGEYKGIGDGLPLTEPQREFIQSQTDYYGAIIRANVKKYRSAIADEDLQGQWFPGRQAAAKSFVTELADDTQGAIAYFRRRFPVTIAA